MNNVSNSSATDYASRGLTDRDWIDRGKEDAWTGKSKCSPEHDPQAASMYDLGYCEGVIEKPPVQPKIKEEDS